MKAYGSGRYKYECYDRLRKNQKRGWYGHRSKTLHNRPVEREMKKWERRRGRQAAQEQG